MANVIFKRGTTEKIRAADKIDGQILVDKTTGEMYNDIGDKRLKVTDTSSAGKIVETGGEIFNDYDNNIAGGKGFVIESKYAGGNIFPGFTEREGWLTYEGNDTYYINPSHEVYDERITLGDVGGYGTYYGLFTSQIINIPDLDVNQEYTLKLNILYNNANYGHIVINENRSINLYNFNYETGMMEHLSGEHYYKIKPKTDGSISIEVKTRIDTAYDEDGDIGYAGPIDDWYLHDEFRFSIELLDETLGTGTYCLQGYEDYIADNEGYEVNDTYSAILNHNFDFNGEIKDIQGNKIVVTNYANGTNDNNKPLTDEEFYALPQEKRTFWVHTKPIIGNFNLGTYQHTEGMGNIAIQTTSHAEGRENIASGKYSHVEGKFNVAGYAAHAEGENNFAKGQASHAEGRSTEATGMGAHAEGEYTHALGRSSHAEGYGTWATNQAHAGGHESKAMKLGSFAHGENLNTGAAYQFVVGKNNQVDTDALFVVGNGTSTAPTNAFSISSDGRATILKGPENNMDLVTKEYVDCRTRVFDTKSNLDVWLGLDLDKIPEVIEGIDNVGHTYSITPKDNGYFEYTIHNIVGAVWDNISLTTITLEPGNYTISRSKYVYLEGITNWNEEGTFSLEVNETREINVLLSFKILTLNGTIAKINEAGKNLYFQINKIHTDLRAGDLILVEENDERYYWNGTALADFIGENYVTTEEAQNNYISKTEGGNIYFEDDYISINLNTNGIEYRDNMFGAEAILSTRQVGLDSSERSGALELNGWYSQYNPDFERPDIDPINFVISAAGIEQGNDTAKISWQDWLEINTLKTQIKELQAEVAALKGQNS